MPEYDSLDYKIIQELRQDARIQASEIARRVGANERTVRKRIDRLVSVGAVRLVGAADPLAFGYTTVLDVFLEIDPEQEARVVQRLLDMQEISYLAYGQGTHDLSIQARFKSNEEMREFLRHTLPAMAGVRVTSSSLVPNIIRNIDEWQPRKEDFGG